MYINNIKRHDTRDPTIFYTQKRHCIVRTQPTKSLSKQTKTHKDEGNVSLIGSNIIINVIRNDEISLWKLMVSIINQQQRSTNE